MSEKSEMFHFCLADERNIAELLLERGAEVNLRSATNERPIIHAQTENDVPLLELLVRSGAEVNFQDAQGKRNASHFGSVQGNGEQEKRHCTRHLFTVQKTTSVS